MKTMKTFLLSLMPGLLYASASAVYVTQSGAGTATGTSLGNAFAISALSDTSKCGSGSTQIGPDTTVYVQGGGTFANNTVMFTLPSACNGTSGHPVILQFKAGDVWQAGYFPAGGFISLSNDSYIVMDGGATSGAGATFQNTTNGSPTAACISGSACSTQQPSKWLEALNVTSLEVRNLNVIDLYIHTKCEASSGCDTTLSNSDTVGVHYGGTGILVHDNVMHDISFINYANSGSAASQSFYNNEFYHMDHGIACGGNASGVVISNLFIYNNHFHDMDNWDTGTANVYHHDGIHCWGATGSKIQNAYIYNNLFDGNEGDCCVTAWVYLEGSTGPAWSDSTGTAHIWNNVFIGSMDLPNSQIYVATGTGHQFLNNTLIVASPSGGGCLGFYQGAAAVTIENNVIEGCNGLINSASASTFSAIDYNIYGHASGGSNIFAFGSQQSNTLAGWQAACACDAHSATSSPLSSSLTNIAASGSLSAGFIGIGAGANLLSLATGALATLAADRTGAARPVSAAWDAGAYQYSTTPTCVCGKWHGKVH